MEELNQQQPGAEVAQPGEPVGATERASSETTATASSGADAQPDADGQAPASNASSDESPTDSGGDSKPDALAVARGTVSVGDIFSVVVRESHVTVIGRDAYVIIKDNETIPNVS
ncbi:hypothetical protein [Pandoraea commovens]|uniref:Uncharacterized protein n=1 Tax=Pandoraea commovens TaxID=2508289 RepID=A0A5E4VDV5_9BURK|nr:hypothetical protein [Pandoraea commovens]VVE10311.1 hypothetical protein PCO31010_02613 [Pandoraea commovens]